MSLGPKVDPEVLNQSVCTGMGGGVPLDEAIYTVKLPPLEIPTEQQPKMATLPNNWSVPGSGDLLESSSLLRSIGPSQQEMIKNLQDHGPVTVITRIDPLATGYPGAKHPFECNTVTISADEGGNVLLKDEDGASRILTELEAEKWLKVANDQIEVNRGLKALEGIDFDPGLGLDIPTFTVTLGGYGGNTPHISNNTEGELKQILKNRGGTISYTEYTCGPDIECQVRYNQTTEKIEISSGLGPGSSPEWRELEPSNPADQRLMNDIIIQSNSPFSSEVSQKPRLW